MIFWSSCASRKKVKATKTTGYTWLKVMSAHASLPWLSFSMHWLFSFLMFSFWRLLWASHLERIELRLSTPVSPTLAVPGLLHHCDWFDLHPQVWKACPSYGAYNHELCLLSLSSVYEPHHLQHKDQADSEEHPPSTVCVRWCESLNQNWENLGDSQLPMYWKKSWIYIHLASLSALRSKLLHKGTS